MMLVAYLLLLLHFNNHLKQTYILRFYSHHIELSLYTMPDLEF